MLFTSGGKVVFCDIDLNTFTIDTEKLDRRLRKDQRHSSGHLFGLSADIDPIQSLLKSIPNLVEDAACILGPNTKKSMLVL